MNECSPDLKLRRFPYKSEHHICHFYVSSNSCGRIAPESFNQALIKFDCGVTQFRTRLRKHVVVYIDDIIIYLKILLEHVEHVKLVLITHRKEKFNFNQGSFCMEKVHSIGFIVGKSRVALDRDKVKFIMNLPNTKKCT